jgi:E3 Ubiquitin ligase
MNPAFAIASGVAALLGLLCLWFWKKYRDEVALMAATPTSRAADVAALAPGTIVEVKGTIRCAAPLSGEFSRKTCVYSKSEIERKEERWKDGKRETHYVTESSVERHAPFQVEDASGRVPVRGDGASVEAVQVYNENANTTAESVVSTVLSLTGQGNYERRYKESILAPDIPVYVLGTVQQGGVIGAAPHGAKIKEFIITYKSEEERTRSSGRTAMVLLIIGVVLFIGAAVSLGTAFKYP